MAMSMGDFRLRAIPNVRIESPSTIGSGAFGDVWLAIWTPPHLHGASSRVALKIPNQRAMRDPALKEAFRKEGKTIYELRHPNIIGVYDVNDHGGLPYIMMEYAGKGCLRDYVKTMDRSEPDGRKKRCLMCVDVAAGMEYLEARRIVHRDLAARNVLVKNDGTCKIGDFGLTRQVSGPSSHAGYVAYPQTQSQPVYMYVASHPEQRCFPILWSAPEVFEGRSSSKSDVWSFGVLIWEVMTFGSLPLLPGLSGQNSDAHLNVLRAGFRLSQPAGCRYDIIQLMRSMWKWNPSERPSFSSVRDCLQRIATSPPAPWPVSRSHGGLPRRPFTAAARPSRQYHPY